MHATESQADEGCVEDKTGTGEGGGAEKRLSEERGAILDFELQM